MNGKFDILSAVKNAYLFTWRESRYLLGLCAIPLIIYILTVIAVQNSRPDAGIIEGFLWSLPAEISLSWYMFASTRLIIFGERLQSLSKSEDQIKARKYAMHLSIMMFILFKMALTAMTACIYWIVALQKQTGNISFDIAALILIALLLWGLRFSVAHIITATGYSMHSFLAKIRGMTFSFYLMAMGIVCSAPVYILGLVLISITIPVAPDSAISTGQINAAIIIAVPFMFLTHTLMNAAAAFALKDILGRRGNK